MNRYNQSGAIQMMNIKAVLLCGAAIFVATSAQAETRWSGFAINAGFGAGAMVNDLKILPGPLVPPGLFAVDLDGIGGEGVLGTIGVSADYQFQRRFVVGAFFDYDFSGIKSTLDVSIPTLGNLQARGDTKLDSQWTVGARLGYLTSPDTLIYALAGYTHVEMSDPRLTISGPLAASIGLGLPSLDGWTAGFGMETMLMSNLSVKAEYRYSQLSDQHITLPNIGPINPNAFVDTRLEPSIHTGRLVLSYKFNWEREAAPVEPLK